MKWRFNHKERKERRYEWHRWFALWPVKVDLVDHTWCWLSFVERQRIKDSEIGDFWDYREIESVPPRIKMTEDWGRELKNTDWGSPRSKPHLLLPHEPLFSVFDPPEK